MCLQEDVCYQLGEGLLWDTRVCLGAHGVMSRGRLHPSAGKACPHSLSWALLLMNNHKKNLALIFINLKTPGQASNCRGSQNPSSAGRGASDRGLKRYFLYPSNMPCSLPWVTTLRAWILCQLRKREFSWITSWMHSLFFYSSSRS